MQSTRSNLAARGITPSSGDSVARGNFSARSDGTFTADTQVSGNANLRMSGRSTGPSGQTNTVNISQTAAQQEIEEIASEPGSSALKMQLAQQGISLTDHSDVGPGRRFATFEEKLDYIRKLKMALLVSVMMSMASSSGWGPNESEDVTLSRDALRMGRQAPPES